MIKYFVIIFAIFVISRNFLRYREKVVTITEFLFWSFFWLIVMFFIWRPQTIDNIAVAFGIQRGVDFAFYVAFLLIFYIVFKIYIKIDKLEHNISLIIGEIAMSNAKQIEKKKKQD
jgi:small membrane protein